MKIKAVVFDKDGTIVDYPAYWYPVAKRAAEREYELLGIKAEDIPQGEIEDHLREIGITETSVDIDAASPRGDHKALILTLMRRASALGARFGFDEYVNAFSAAFSDPETKAQGKVLPTTPDLYKTLLELRSRGIIIALITSDDQLGAKVCLDALGVTDLFDKIMGFDANMPAKPAPDRMYSFLSEYGLKSDEVVMVGDTRTDLDFARNSGVRFIGVAKDEASSDILKSAGAEHTVCDVSEIFSVPGLFD